MNSYNSQALTHAGFILALIIGLFTLVSSQTIWDFYRSGQFGKFVTFSIIGSDLGLCVYFFFKILYWYFLSNAVLSVTMANATSTNSTTLIYGMQIYATQGFRLSKTLFVGFTYTGIGFNWWVSILFYFILPTIVFVILLYVFGALFDARMRLKTWIDIHIRKKEVRKFWFDK